MFSSFFSSYHERKCCYLIIMYQVCIQFDGLFIQEKINSTDVIIQKKKERTISTN